MSVAMFELTLSRRPPARVRGFTLIELLVAIGVLALMAVLTWRGLDGISRAQGQLQQRSDEVQTLQATLGQWTADLDALAEQPNWKSLDWDGRSMRLLRYDSSANADGLRKAMGTLAVGRHDHPSAA